MPTPLSQADLPIIDRGGERRGNFSIKPLGSALHSVLPPLAEALPDEMREWGEERIQLLENRRYEYKLTSSEPLQLRTLEGILTKSNFKDRGDYGIIDTGSNVGLLSFEVEDTEGKAIASINFEVRSSKLRYREHYRQMLEDITSYCTDLLMQIRSPAKGLFKTNLNEPSETIAQRFAFLKYLLSTAEFRNAVARIVADPHVLFISEHVRQEIGRGFRPSNRILRQLASGAPRTNLPEDHPLASKIATVPTHLNIQKQTETVNTAENKFIKYALESFSLFLSDMAAAIEHNGVNSPSDKRLYNDIEELRRSLLSDLSNNIFKEISSPTVLELGSPVLQRREGYREILSAWLRFSAAANLVWSGGQDVYGGGKRDVANLYEYWLFFKLLDSITKVFGSDFPAITKLIEPTADGFGLKLRAGRSLKLKGSCKINNRKLHVRFSYNRVYQRRGSDSNEISYPSAGSWTRIMRPDYSLSIWPEELDEGQAEILELITHIHFDAKYKLQDNFSDNYEAADETPEATLRREKESNRLGRTTKRTDLLTLHAYKDAIRRTEGAYVLYPGDQTIKWRTFHEILPGIGAFSIRPDDGGKGMMEIETFLKDIADHTSNRASARERERYYLQQTHSLPLTQVTSALPELSTGLSRPLPPYDHIVLICAASSQAHLNWITNNLYFDLPLEEGPINSEVLLSRHIVIGLNNTLFFSGPFKIVNGQHEVVLGSTLKSLNYPNAVIKKNYLLFKLEPDNTYSELLKGAYKIGFSEKIKAVRLPDLLY